MFVPNYYKIGIRKAADNQVFSVMAKKTSDHVLNVDEKCQPLNSSSTS